MNKKNVTKNAFSRIGILNMAWQENCRCIMCVKLNTEFHIRNMEISLGDGEYYDVLKQSHESANKVDYDRWWQDFVNYPGEWLVVSIAGDE